MNYLGVDNNGQLLELVLTGNVQKHHEDKGGVYIFQENDIHGMRLWEHKNGKFAIWWNEESHHWIIGDQSNQGRTSGTIIGPFNDNRLPTNIQSWKYFEKEKWFGRNNTNLIDAADSEIIFIDLIATNNCWIDASNSDLRLEQIPFVKRKHL